MSAALASRRRLPCALGAQLIEARERLIGVGDVEGFEVSYPIAVGHDHAEEQVLERAAVRDRSVLVHDRHASLTVPIEESVCLRAEVDGELAVRPNRCNELVADERPQPD